MYFNSVGRGRPPVELASPAHLAMPPDRKMFEAFPALEGFSLVFKDITWKDAALKVWTDQGCPICPHQQVASPDANMVNLPGSISLLIF